MTMMKKIAGTTVIAGFLSLLTASALPCAGTYREWRASLPADYPATRDYLRMLAKWVEYCEVKRYWGGRKLTGPQGRDLSLNYAMALACLVSDPDYDHSINHLSRAVLRSRLNTAVAKMSLDPGFTRFAALILVLAEKDLSSANRKKIMDAIYKHRGLPGVDTEPWGKRADESAEQDSWRVGTKSMFPAFYPDHKEHDRRLDRLQRDWVDLLCTQDMKENRTMVGAPRKPLNRWASGVNFNADYTFDNHFPFHLGYMYDAIETMSLVWTVYKHKGHPIPNTFYWNERNIYDRCLRRFHLWDGRNFYPKGTDWSMYLYGVGEEMSYYAARKFIYNDRVAAAIERGLAASYEWRQKHFNGDLSGFTTYPNVGGMFGDCVFDVVCAYFPNRVLGPWAGGFATEAELNARANGNFRSRVSAYTVTNRTSHRLAKAGDRGWAVIPRNGDHMGSWEGSRAGGTLSGSVVGHCTEFDGGFVSTKTSCFVALPDGKSVLIIEQARSSRQSWKIGNWLFNDQKRTVYHAAGSTVYARRGKSGSIRSPWINIDNKISYIDLDGRSNVFSAAEGDLSPKGTFWLGRYIGYVRFRHAGRAMLILADVTSAQTQAYVAAGEYQLLTTTQAESGAALVKGQDGLWYLVLSNFSRSRQRVSTTLPFTPSSHESITRGRLATAGARVSTVLGGYDTGVFRLRTGGP